MGTFTGTAQQFVSDNQWVAPEGVATVIGTAGETYAQLDLVMAFVQEWEFNFQLVHYYDDPRSISDSYTNTSVFVKRRFYQNEDETAGYAAMAGFGLFPEHRDQGEVISSLNSWWAQGIATFAFANNSITWDILPGATVNFDHKQRNKTAWGFTYSSRAAFYNIIPQSALVGEVFGTAGEARAPISYRAGIRWESPKWILSATYSTAFDSSFGAGFEIGFMYFTDSLYKKKENKPKLEK